LGKVSFRHSRRRLGEKLQLSFDLDIWAVTLVAVRLSYVQHIKEKRRLGMYEHGFSWMYK
jgi:hypothetical protein